MGIDKEGKRRSLSDVMLWIASLGLAGMMLIVVADVVLRLFFSTPVRGAYDIVSIGLVIMVFFGLAPVIARGSEIVIDLIDAFFPRPVIVLFEAVASLSGFALLIFLGWAMISPAQDAYRWGGYSLELGLPVWWQWAIAFAGLTGVLWTCALRLWRDFRRLGAVLGIADQRGGPSK